MDVAGQPRPPYSHNEREEGGRGFQRGQRVYDNDTPRKQQEGLYVRLDVLGQRDSTAVSRDPDASARHRTRAADE